MALDDEDRSFAARYAAKRTKSDEEVADWINGRGQLIIAGVFIAFLVWGVFVLASGG